MRTVVTQTDLKKALIKHFSNNPPIMQVHSDSEQILTAEFDYNYNGDNGLESIYLNPYSLNFTSGKSRKRKHLIAMNFVFEKLRGGEKALATVGESQTMIGAFKVSLSPDYNLSAWRNHLKVELVSFESDHT